MTTPVVRGQPTVQPQTQPDESVCCKACGHAITARSKAIAVNGSHEHTFRNPAGYSYHVVCFSDARGSRRTGTPTMVATWFPGFAWSYAICGQCDQHLGWWFAGSETFAGLIATRLAGAGANLLSQ